MRYLKPVLLVLAIAPALTGCVIAIDADEWDGGQNWSPGWEQRQHDNLDYINALALGESVGNVRADLGAPDFSETFQRDGERFEVLFYRTHRFRNDGATSKDETTPLVFVAGQLVGWGDTAIEKATVQ